MAPKREIRLDFNIKTTICLKPLHFEMLEMIQIFKHLFGPHKTYVLAQVLPKLNILVPSIFTLILRGIHAR